ncbi:MAG: hypothetical protein R3Y54_13750, partial [Eubacteriales bacterium]
DELQYAGRTSGVLLESVFVDTVPIAPSCLYEVGDMKGIRYERLEDLKEVFATILEEDVVNYRVDNNKIREVVYGKQRVKEELTKRLFDE